MAQEDHAQHWHKVVAGGQLGVGTEVVRRLPEVSFEFFDVFEGVGHAMADFSYPVYSLFVPRRLSSALINFGWHHQTIHRLGALPRLQHQQGVDVNLLHHATQVKAELREFAQHIDNRVEVSRLLPTCAFENRGAFEGVNHLACFGGIERRHAQHGVVQHLDKNAAQAEDNARAKLWVARHTDDGLASAMHHLLHRHAL